MSQSLWDTEPQEEPTAAEQERKQSIPSAEPGEPEPQEHEEPESLDPEEAEMEEPEEAFEPQTVEPADEKTSDVLVLSSDEFTALEERILRAVNLVKRERLARADAEVRADAAEARVAALDAQLLEQTPQVDRLQAEIHTLRTERDQVRQRVERLLSQLDALEL